jgi:hypothetical protein
MDEPGGDVDREIDSRRNRYISAVRENLTAMYRSQGNPCYEPPESFADKELRQFYDTAQEDLSREFGTAVSV